MVNRRLLIVLSFLASFFALSVIGLGAFTRLIDAGLGCPDWPGCYGHLMVPMSENAQSLVSLHYPETPLNVYKAWAEMIHRYFAGCLSVVILIIILLIFTKPLRKLSNIVLATNLFLLIIYQVLLGQWTVTFKLLPFIVTQHLLGGFLILISLWLIFLNNRERLRPFHKVNHWILIGAFLGLILLVGQIFLGAWTSTQYASLSCPDFPLCGNIFSIFKNHFYEAFNFSFLAGINYEGGILSEGARQVIQMTHRLGALLLIIYMLFFTICAFPVLKQYSEYLKPLFFIWGLLVTQLFIGIVNIIYKLPLITAISHNLMAALLLLAMVTLTFKLVIANKEV